MPTNKLWIEHTERAAWDSVEALRERLLKAESRLQALASGVDRVPELLDRLDEAKQKYAPEAQSHDEVVAQLLGRIEKLQAELEAAKTPEPTQVTFAPPLPRPRLDSDDLDEPQRRRVDDDDSELAGFAQTMQRHSATSNAEPTRDLNRLLTQAEQKLDDLTELEGAALREAAIELAILAGRIYVALTRAQSQVVAWYCPTANNTAPAPLHRMLFGRAPGHPVVHDEQSVMGDDEVVDILGRWKAAGGPQPELATPGTVDTTPIERDLPSLSVRSFDRAVDTDWRRTSYSALSAAGAPHAGAPDRVLSEPDDAPDLDDAELEALPDEVAAPEADLALAAVASPMADLPVGAEFGSLVHEVLEHADPSAPDLRAELLAQVEEHRAWWAVEVDADVLADALVAVCDSPLGPLAAGLTLRDIGIPDRLRELDFELPLAGGDLVGPGTDHVVLGDLGPLLRAHLPAGDPLLAFADTLSADADLAGQRLLGYLTGSIDVVVRVQVDGRTRFLTIDYKTNWLGDRAAPATAWDYRPAVLDEAMGHSDYPLQALLYTVVLHRYLRWRLPGYDPAEHLGGVLYLYLRGMCGPETPSVDGRPCGVFSWQPPVALVTALSDLLDGKSS